MKRTIVLLLVLLVMAGCGQKSTQPVPPLAPAAAIELDTNGDGAIDLNKGGTGGVTASAARTSLGLGSVNNTTDLAKPISTAVQAALNGKANGTVSIFRQTTQPGTCIIGDLWIDTDATSGQRMYSCESGGWVLQAGGGTGGSYTLPAATLTTLGGVKPGPGVAAGTDGTLTPDYSYLQARVEDVCAPGSAIRSISPAGYVTCEVDDQGSGTLPVGTSAGQTVRWDGSTYVAGSFAFNMGSINDLQLNGSPLIADSAGIGDTDRLLSADRVTGLLSGKVDLESIDTQLEFEALVGWPIPTAGGSSGYLSVPPTYSDEACVPGQHALSEIYRYDCVSSGNWNRTALTNWSNPAPVGGTADTFDRADGGLGGSWLSGSSPVTYLAVASNQCSATGDWVVGAGRYASSTSSTSQAVLAGNSPNDNATGQVCVRMGSASDGYCAYLRTQSAGNYTEMGIQKDGEWLCDVSALAYSIAVNHTLKIVASGTSPVTINAYVDGSLVTSGCQDTASPIASGNPGIKISASGTVRPNLDNWQGY